MSRALPIFTPSLAPREVLEELFVARHRLLDDIVERVRAAGTTSTRNHTLLVGPRGAGKTHLVSLVYHRARELREEGEVTLQLAWLPEDPWATTSYRRLLDAVATQLEPALDPDERPSSVDAAEALLVERATRLGPVVCFVENFDQVLHSIEDAGQQRLRRLAQARALLFVATTTTLSRDLSDQAAPFYSFFTTTALVPLTLEQAASMVRGIAAHQGNVMATEYLETDEAIARLRTVAHLAGGQPRIWALLAQAVTVDGLEELVQLLLTKFDDLTPYYQEQLARLSPQQRDIVVTLVELDHPVSVKELADSTGIDQRSLAKTIVELRDRGWVVETASPLTKLLDQRRTYYELGEPLARLAFQLKASRGTPIELIVEFLKSWFDPADLADDEHGDQLVIDYLRQAAAGHATDPVLAVSRRLHELPASRVPVLDLLGRLDDACSALAAGDAVPLLRMPTSLRSAVEEQLGDDFDDDEAVRMAVSSVRFRLHHEALKEFGYVPKEIGQPWYERALTLLDSPGDRASSLTYVSLWLGRLWRFAEAEDISAELMRLVDRDDERALRAFHDLGISYWNAGRFDEAIRTEEEAVGGWERLHGSDHRSTLIARSRLEVSYLHAGRVDEAVALAEQVVADCERVLGADDTDTLAAKNNLAIVYWAMRRVPETTHLLEKVVAAWERLSDPDHPNLLIARSNLAAAYTAGRRLDDAVGVHEALLLACERTLGPDDPNTLRVRANLASTYRSVGREQEAIAVLEQDLTALERVLGANHPHTVMTRETLTLWKA